MIPRSIGLSLILATLTGIALFLIKGEVQEREARLDRLTRETLEHEEAIHVLKAEWSYLNQPERIERLIGRHLNLQPTEISQLSRLDDLPTRLSQNIDTATPQSAQLAKDERR